MKKLNVIYTVLLLLLVAPFAFGQKKTTPNLNLLAGKFQENGLPKGWKSILEGSGSAKFQNGSIFLERDNQDDKCIVIFTANMPDGNYILKASYKTNGNNPQLFLDSKPLEEINEVKSVSGQIQLFFTLKGNGKVWSYIEKLILTKVSKKQN